MKFINFCNGIIRWSFYSLFFLIPIVFTGDTSELFEFNKMWLTFGLTAIIIAAWISKMIVQKQFRVQRTPLDIPILLFLLSQIISTIHSLDPYVSWWGYYSRFNGGLLSTITYIFLYYAFVSNLGKKYALRILQVSLFSGLFVSVWGLPAHFGYDPTCFIFRGTFDVSCWTDAFQPKARIFSTMGQPDWLAAYLLILIPIAIAFGINAYKRSKFMLAAYYSLLTTLFYVDFIYTKSKGSFVAFVIPAVLFIPAYFWITKESLGKAKYLWGMIIAIGVFTFFIGTPLPQLDKFTYAGLAQKFSSPPPQTTGQTKQTTQPQKQAGANPITGEFGGSDSGKIRLFVWKGAIDAWRHNILFGTGIETFAFAYYLYRPAGHNLTSEWDYLYNKAHNEYLNYLATTGAFGLLTYLAIIGLFLFLAIKIFWIKNLPLSQNNKQKGQTTSDLPNRLILLSLVISFLTIIISNFFGFSVVIVNIYLFILPACFFILADMLNPNTVFVLPRTTNDQRFTTNVGQWLAICVIWLVCLYCWGILANYWGADKAYGLGQNLDRAGQYQSAYAPLHQAISGRPDEPVFQDELTVNDAALAVGLAVQKDATNAGKLMQEAIQLSNDVTTNHPNNVTFWKTRTRVMYTLSEIDPQYLPFALSAIQRAHALAPTDAKIFYNLGLLYGQNGQTDKAINSLKQTVKLKPDYRDAYYALGVMLHQSALDKNNKVVDLEKEKEAAATMNYILHTLSPSDKQTQDMLKSWGEM